VHGGAVDEDGVGLGEGMQRQYEKREQEFHAEVFRQI
jgi:hypothetical protein